MDPEKALEDLIYAIFALLGSVQQVGWGAPVNEVDDDYRAVLTHRAALAEWIAKGGFEPSYTYRGVSTSYGKVEAMADNMLSQAEALYVTAGQPLPTLEV